MAAANDEPEVSPEGQEEKVAANDESAEGQEEEVDLMRVRRSRMMNLNNKYISSSVIL